MKLMGEDRPELEYGRTLACNAAQKCYQDLNETEINALFTAVDHDGNDAISFEEFCVLALSLGLSRPGTR